MFRCPTYFSILFVLFWFPAWAHAQGTVYMCPSPGNPMPLYSDQLTPSEARERGCSALGGADKGSLDMRWRLTTEGDGFRIYVDRSSIRRSGNTVRVWQLWMYERLQRLSSGEFYQSEKRLVLYNCPERTAAGLQATRYADKYAAGEVIDNSSSSAGGLQHIIPETVGETLFKEACLSAK
jgi:hypothetical protein